MIQWLAIVCAVSLGSGCTSTIDDLSGMLASNLKAGAKSSGHPTEFKVTLVHFPIGPQVIGNGQQFDNEDFSHAQWNLRQVSPNL